MSQPLPSEADLIKRGPVDRRLEAIDSAMSHGFSKLTVGLIVAVVTSLLLNMFGAFYFVRAFSRLDTAATTTSKIQAVQQAQAESSANGRAILLQQAALTKIIAAQTSPTATAQQQAQVAGYLKSLTDAQKTLNADQLRKLGELAIVLGAPAAAVNRILAESVPVITFGPAPASAPSSSPAPLSTPMPTRSATVSPSPSHSSFLHVQCPVICPQSP
jgi:hypothetical protein